MKNNFRILVAIASLALSVLACQAISGGPSSVAPVDTQAPGSTDVPAPAQTEAPTGNSDVLFEDDFSTGSDLWGTGTDADSSVEYVDDALNLQIFTTSYIVWTYPNEENYKNIHMEVTVINNGTDSTSAFGLFCDQQHPITDSRYFFAVTPAGQYAIVQSSLARDDVFLTNKNKWASSDLIAKNAASYRIGADCGNGKLTLYVDGQQIDSVDDSTYTTGGIALFAWSRKDTKTTNVSFDDFVMTSLP